MKREKKRALFLHLSLNFWPQKKEKKLRKNKASHPALEQMLLFVERRAGSSAFSNRAFIQEVSSYNKIECKN